MKPPTIPTLTSALCLTAGLTLAQTPAVTNAPSKSPPWEASAAAGLTLTRGNSKTLLFTANLAAAKNGTKTNWASAPTAFMARTTM
ncbi:MAG TPA: hypothetical protein VNZ64_14670 [Candidatus Acidoferrum sp.]|nr:hypothetical protein [Candidatus Acidoferrum sp.]